MKHFVKVVSCLFSVVSLFIATAGYADNPKITTSPSPVGSGARALGMGRAFIAVADDATAASWNPAGLIQLNNIEVSIVGEGIIRRKERLASENIRLSLDGENQNMYNNIDVNFASITAPVRIGLNPKWYGVLSLSYQKKYDYTREWNYSASGRFFDEETTVEQDGFLSTLSLAGSLRVFSPCLSVGATVNFWEDYLGKDNSWEEIEVTTLSPKQSIGGNNEQLRPITSVARYNFSNGINYNIGLLWNNTLLIDKKKWRYKIGAIYRTGFSGDLEHENNDGFSGISYEMNMPASYGFGLAIQSEDGRMLATSDFSFVEWEDYTVRDDENTEYSLINSRRKDEAGISTTYQYRLGFEYVFEGSGINTRFPLCFGFSYDQAPSGEGYDEYYGFSAGLGLVWEDPERIFFKGVSLDIAYQLRYGNDLGMYRSTDKITYDLREHKTYFSAVIYF